MCFLEHGTFTLEQMHQPVVIFCAQNVVCFDDFHEIIETTVHKIFFKLITFII